MSEREKRGQRNRSAQEEHGHQEHKEDEEHEEHSCPAVSLTDIRCRVTPVSGSNYLSRG